MGKIVTIAINKGGTGKTTIAVHLAHHAAEHQHRTLLVDLDSQANATDTLGGVTLGTATASELFGPFDFNKPTRQVSPTLDLLPADRHLLATERAPLESANTFISNLRNLAQRYDLLVVDTPPTMGFAMLAPLLASDYAVAPVIPDAFSIKGVRALIERIEEVRTTRNPSLRFLGVLINKWQRRNAAQNAVVDTLQKSLKRYIVPYALPDLVPIANAAHKHEPVWRGARSGSERRATKIVREVMTWLLQEACPETPAKAAGAR